MRLQVRSERLYNKRVAVAINRATSLEINLVDARGHVLRSYEQTFRREPNLDAYHAAASPPIDDCMERQEERMRQRFRHRRFQLKSVRYRQQSNQRESLEGRRFNRRLKKVYGDPRIAAVRPAAQGQKHREWRQSYQDTVKEKPRPPGTVAMF